jgi:hypothetical protein
LFEIASNLGVSVPDSSETDIHSAALKAMDKYLTMRGSVKEADVLHAAKAAWSFANDTGDPDEAFFADIFRACVTITLRNSSRQLLPQFSGVPVDAWRGYLARNGALRVLWPAQRAIGEIGAFKGNNVAIQMPTGVGKTKSLALVIRARLLAGAATRLIVVAPLRALCREIANSLRSDLSGIAQVSELSDVLQNDISDDFRDDWPTVAVCTPEKLNYLIHHNRKFLDTVDFFAFDEAHMIDTPARGPTYELLLTEIKISCKTAQLILISAVVPNSGDLTKWLFGRTDVTTDSSKIPFTQKSIGIAESSGILRYYEHLVRDGESFFVPKSFEVSILNKLAPRETKVRKFPDLDNRQGGGSPERDLALYYALRLASSGSSAIYIPQRPGIRKLFERIRELHQRGVSFKPLERLSRTDSLEKLSRLFSEHYGPGHPFTATLSHGVLPHYSGLPEGLRCSIEDEMATGGIRCVACTPTLAQGVNLPIKYLLITGTQHGMSRTSARDFQNLIGRTARSGIYSEGSIILTDCRLAADRRKSAEFDSILDPERQEKCSSAILGIFKDFRTWKQRIAGKHIGDIIIKNLSVENWDVGIAKVILRELPGLKEAQVISEMRLRKMAVESIENYLCLMIEKDGDGGAVGRRAYINTLCEETFAFQMADEEEQKLLGRLFEVIGERLNEAEKEHRIPLYTSSMLGIAATDLIIEWFGENAASLVDYSIDDLRDALIDEYLLIFQKEASEQDANLLKSTAKYWIDGLPYCEMATAIRNLDDPVKGIARIEKLCSEDISYSLSRFTGSAREIAEALETDDSLIARLADLQQQLKYGLQAKQEQLIYRKISNDRLIAARVSEILESEIDSVDTLRAAMRLKFDEIANIFNEYPDYFAKRLSRFMQDDDQSDIY